MKQSKLIIFLGSILSFSAVANYTIDTEACAGIEHIYDLNGDLVKYDPVIHTFVDASTPVFYNGSSIIPHLFLVHDRASNILFQNTSQQHINVHYYPTYVSEQTGAISNVASELYYGQFSSSNSPKNPTGANMPPNSIGRINIPANSVVQYGRATIHWGSSICVDELPMLTSVENALGYSNKLGMSIYLVNDGKPW